MSTRRIALAGVLGHFGHRHQRAAGPWPVALAASAPPGGGPADVLGLRNAQSVAPVTGWAESSSRRPRQ